jgi:CheY-like chemotaxis protein
MHGSIAVESEPGRGSRFRFTVELAGAGADPSGAGAKSLAEVRSLIVDDNAVSRASLARLLTAWSSPPVVAASGRDALADLQTAASAGRPFRLVLIDQRMAGLDGLALAREIRRRPELGAPAVVLLGSAIIPVRPADLAECGVALCVGKPIRKRELRAGILAALGAAGNPASSATPTPRR